jgi:thioredoxin 1
MDGPNSLVSTPAIDAEAVDDLLKQNTAVAIHFWAPWNNYDRPFDQKLSVLAPKFADRVKFFSCNMDDERNHALTTKYKVVNVPTLLIFFEGAAHAPILGNPPQEKLEAEIIARLVPVEPKRPWWKFWLK